MSEDINKNSNENAASAPKVEAREEIRKAPEAASSDQPMQRIPRFKKKVCRFCHDKNASIDYKNSGLLGRFITDRGKILPRRVTGTCAKHQRHLAKEIKRARIIALLPFVEL